VPWEERRWFVDQRQMRNEDVDEEFEEPQIGVAYISGKIKQRKNDCAGRKDKRYKSRTKRSLYGKSGSRKTKGRMKFEPKTGLRIVVVERHTADVRLPSARQ
jgi:hypothetical protein